MDGVVKKIQAMCAGRSDGHPQKHTPTLLTDAPSHSMMHNTFFASPEERAFDDVFFGEWLEAPVAFGAFEGDTLLGYAEGSPESWNGRFRLSNICIFERSARGKGVGTMLLKALEEAAEASSTRMLVLETQSCNEAAIGFYKRNGFAVIGFDLYAYSNDDPERHEVRIEMGKKLK